MASFQLLHKQAGNPLDSKEKQNPPRKFSEQPTTDGSMWQQPVSSYSSKAQILFQLTVVFSGFIAILV